MAIIQLNKQDADLMSILERIVNQSREMIQTMRGVVWVINPQSDDAFDFFDKIRSFAEVVLQSRQIKLSFQLINPVEYFLNLEIQRNLFLICKELIVNIARHSGATEASINIQTGPNFISIQIEDNGRGFDPQIPSDGNGLRNAQNRSEQINGELEFFSKRGEGTRIALIIQIARMDDQM